VGSTQSHKNGNFRMIIPSGSYLIRAMPSKYHSPIFYVDQWWDDQSGSFHVQGAQQINVIDNQKKEHILFRLQKGSAVRGIVLTPSLQPIANIRIIASDLQKDMVWGTSITDSLGQFVISGIPPGMQNLHFDSKSAPPHVLSLWTLGAMTEQTIEVIEGKIKKVQDFILPTGGAIQGYISNQKKEPIKGICVIAVQKCGDICFGQAKTDDKGEYLIKGLPEGAYFVQTNISCDDFPGDYIDKFWHSNTGTPVCHKAEKVLVQKNLTTKQIDVVLSKDISFVGQVTDIADQPIENVCVVVSSQCDQEWAGEAISDASGEFVITGIPRGNYYIHTEASCYKDQEFMDQWWHPVTPALTCNAAKKIDLPHSNMKIPIHFKLPIQTAQVFAPDSNSPLKDGQYQETVDSGKVVINIHDNLMDLIVDGVPLENVLQIISKYTGIKVLLFGTLKDKIFFDRRDSKLDDILLDLIHGRAGHIFIYSPNRLMTSYIFSKDGQLKPTALSSNSITPPPIQLNLDKPLSIMQPEEIENILNANGRVEEKIHTLGALIGYFDSEHALNFLKTALDDSDEEVRMMAISVMNDLKENHLAVNDLTRSLDRDLSPAVRALAAEALGEIGDKRAVRQLMDALNDRDAGVRETVRRALNNIQGR